MTKPLKDRRVLVIAPSWVGDIVMAQSLFITLKQQNPNSIIDALAPEWSRPVLARMPQINRIIDMPVGHGQLMLGERWRIGNRLKAENYDQAIVLPNSLKSALIPLFGKIPLRTGWKGEMRYGLLNDLRRLDRLAYPSMVQRFNALAYPDGAVLPETLPAPTLVADFERLPQLREKFSLNNDRPVLVLCPGAEFGSAKRWPEKHYATVAEEKIDGGWQVWLMGSENDSSIVNNIFEQLSETQKVHAHRLAGVTGLDEAIDLIAASDAVVSNDSGLMHIASALNRPLVAIYGSTSNIFTPPLSARAATVSIAVDCGPCFNRDCPKQHLKCLNELLPSQVLTALNQQLEAE